MTISECTKYIKPAAIQVLEEMPNKMIFSADEFKRLVVRICPRAKRSHIASVIRPLWDYRLSENKKCSFICIDPSRSMYQKISLAEWKPMERELLRSKKENQIEKSIRLLEENGYRVERT